VAASSQPTRAVSLCSALASTRIHPSPSSDPFPFPHGMHQAFRARKPTRRVICVQLPSCAPVPWTASLSKTHRLESPQA